MNDLWVNPNCGLEQCKNENIHFPYQVIIGTEDNIADSCKEISERMDNEKFYLGKHYETILKFLSLDMDAFITTNYSYEAEIAIDEKFLKRKDKYGTYTNNVQRREAKYFINSLYRMQLKDSIKDFWHIHGEAKNRSSIVIGQYEYGKLLSRELQYIESFEERRKRIKTEMITPKSWIDYFLIGNIYIVGLGLSMAEYDLWWLINRKKREELYGKIFYYCNKKDKLSVPEREMLRLNNVDVIYDERDTDSEAKDYYAGYYNWVYQDILKKISMK